MIGRVLAGLLALVVILAIHGVIWLWELIF